MARVATDIDKLLQSSVAELISVSSRPSGPSFKQKSTDSSHLHLRVPEPLTLRRSEFFSHKLLLTHWWGRPLHPQPLHAPPLRGWLCLLRTGARDLCVTHTDTHTQVDV